MPGKSSAFVYKGFVKTRYIYFDPQTVKYSWGTEGKFYSNSLLTSENPLTGDPIYIKKSTCILLSEGGKERQGGGGGVHQLMFLTISVQPPSHFSRRQGELKFPGKPTGTAYVRACCWKIRRGSCYTSTRVNLAVESDCQCAARVCTCGADLSTDE